MKKFCLLLALIGAIVAIGCGSSDQASTVAETQAQGSTTKEPAGPSAADWSAAATPKAPPGGDWAELSRAAGTEAGQLLYPAGPPPGEIVVKELRAGSGPKLEPEDWFTIDYVALNYKSGKVQQKFWGGPGFEWVYGPGKETEALVVGMEGMREGGLRELVAPSALAYGNGALVYVVKLRKVDKKG